MYSLTISRAGLKGGQREQLPWAPCYKGAPRDEIYLFQIKYSFEKFVIQKRSMNTTLLYSYVLLSVKGTQQQLISLHQGWGTYLLSRAA